MRLAPLFVGGMLLCTTQTLVAQSASAGSFRCSESRNAPIAGELINPSALLLKELLANLQMNVQAFGAAFGVMPQIYFYDDGNIPNAYACAPSARSPQGMIAIGLTLFLSEYRALVVRQSTRPGLHSFSITVVMMHEFAHIAQARYALVPAEWTGVDRELQADYFAGFLSGALSARGYWRSADIEEAAAHLRENGDLQRNDAQTHGNKCQREEVFERGVADGKAFPTLTLFQVADRSRMALDRVRDLPCDPTSPAH